jgi:hypothetical protein
MSRLSWSVQESLVLTREAIASTLKQIANFASGSKLAMSFYLPMELDVEDQPMQEIAEKGLVKQELLL